MKPNEEWRKNAEKKRHDYNGKNGRRVAEKRENVNLWINNKEKKSKYKNKKRNEKSIWTNLDSYGQSSYVDKRGVETMCVFKKSLNK